MPYDIQSRLQTYSKVSSSLAHLDNAQLASMLADSDREHGWGGTHIVKVGGNKVFVKLVPLTDLEYENPFSTRNLYDMPMYYNYGVGSAGFGAYRELVAHIKTTGWVQDGSCTNFPLLYHYRIVPFIGEPNPMPDDGLRGYIGYWGGDANIERYIVERGRARHQLVLCLEYFPHVANMWLNKNASHWESFVRELTEAASFMRSKGMIHFDIHFANVVLDGRSPYVADFGLALDKSFHLTEAEQRFFSWHIDYDLAYIPSAVGGCVFNYFQNASEHSKSKLQDLYGVSTDDYRGTVTALIENIEAIHSAKLIKLDDYYVDYVIRHRELILAMQRFFSSLRDNHKKNTPFPTSRVKLLLKG